MVNVDSSYTKRFGSMRWMKRGLVIHRVNTNYEMDETWTRHTQGRKTVLYRLFGGSVVEVLAALAVPAQGADVGDRVMDKALVQGAAEESVGQGSLGVDRDILTGVGRSLPWRSGPLDGVDIGVVGGDRSWRSVARTVTIQQGKVGQAVHV
ncbi:hypothetical protein J6590_098608 [Homalodisca vitripennis]|nr:hypothetical protein J6590_098608 [Homalodisca vitripennis]